MRVAVEEAVPEDHRHPRLGDRGTRGRGAPRARAAACRRRRAACPRATRASARARACTASTPSARGRAGRRRSCGGTSARCAPRAGSRAPGGAGARTRRRAPRASMKSSARTRSFTSFAAWYSSVEVGLDLARRAGALHLHGDLLPVRQRRAVHLADRRGGDRLLVEVEEQPLDRVAEILLDHALGLVERERAHVVLERTQLGDDVGRDDVGPRREQLPELHERRPELVEAPRADAGRGSSRRPPPTRPRAAPRPSDPAAGR